jgi:hypothetical protein
MENKSEEEPMENWKQFHGTELGGLLGKIYGNDNKPLINYPKLIFFTIFLVFASNLPQWCLETVSRIQLRDQLIQHKLRLFFVELTLEIKKLS